MEEIWKSIEGYEGFYEVSTYGRVRSVDRVIEYSNGNKSKHKGRILKGESDRKGYKRVRLSKNDEAKKFQVHRLVAIAFIPNPENKPFVNHIDEISSNNCVDNLEWVTGFENMRHGTIQQRLSDLKKKPVRCINDGKEFGSVNEASEYYGIERRLISGVLSGAKKTTYGLRFEYL